MIITVPGYSTIGGSPEAILKLMHDARVMPTPEGDGYIQTVQQEAKTYMGIDLEVTGDSYGERAESLLREMAKHDMINIEEED